MGGNMGVGPALSGLGNHLYSPLLDGLCLLGMPNESQPSIQPLVSLRQVHKNYMLGGHLVKALQGIDLTIGDGEFTILTGPSGSGKTSLLNVIGCVDQATSGEVRIAGRDVGSMSDRELSHFRSRNLGFIFQSFNLIPVLTAYENVEYPLRIRKVPEKDMRQLVIEMLEAVGILDHMNHLPGELSGGQRQRVAVARALVSRPQLVLADEPTANLDSKTGTHIIDLMTGIQKKYGTTFLIATHDPMIARNASRELHLHDGQLAENY
jgi:putative ABC transport system ATP-binding protein